MANVKMWNKLEKAISKEENLYVLLVMKKHIKNILWNIKVKHIISAVQSVLLNLRQIRKIS